MPYESINDLPKGVKDNLPRKYLKKLLTKHGMSIKNLKTGRVMLQGKKLRLKFHGPQ